MKDSVPYSIEDIVSPAAIKLKDYSALLNILRGYLMDILPGDYLRDINSVCEDAESICFEEVTTPSRQEIYRHMFFGRSMHPSADQTAGLEFDAELALINSGVTGRGAGKKKSSNVVLEQLRRNQRKRAASTASVLNKKDGVNVITKGVENVSLNPPSLAS